MCGKGRYYWPFCSFLGLLRCGNRLCSSFLQSEKRLSSGHLTSGNGAGNHGIIMLDLAIVGGGPGGLMSAWYLKRKLGELCRITIFEASDRLGGKVLTGRFDSAP